MVENPIVDRRNRLYLLLRWTSRRWLLGSGFVDTELLEKVSQISWPICRWHFIISDRVQLGHLLISNLVCNRWFTAWTLEFLVVLSSIRQVDFSDPLCFRIKFIFTDLCIILKWAKWSVGGWRATDHIGAGLLLFSELEIALWHHVLGCKLRIVNVVALCFEW